MKITLEIDPKYATVISITAIGYRTTGVDVSTYAVDTTKHNLVVLGSDGIWTIGRTDN